MELDGNSVLGNILHAQGSLLLPRPFAWQINMQHIAGPGGQQQSRAAPVLCKPPAPGCPTLWPGDIQGCLAALGLELELAEKPAQVLLQGNYPPLSAPARRHVVGSRRTPRSAL